MSLFERFMLWAGFVRTRRVLDGLSGLKETSWRISVGQHIFGRQYLELVEQHVIRDPLDPSRVVFEDDALAFFRACEAMQKLPHPRIKPKKPTKGRKKHD